MTLPGGSCLRCRAFTKGTTYELVLAAAVKGKGMVCHWAACLACTMGMPRESKVSVKRTTPIDFVSLGVMNHRLINSGDPRDDQTNKSAVACVIRNP